MAKWIKYLEKKKKKKEERKQWKGKKTKQNKKPETEVGKVIVGGVFSSPQNCFFVVLLPLV